MTKQSGTRNPWTYLPSQYFIEGLPYAIINILTTLLYVTMGVPNDTMTKWTSWLMWPWILKPLWAPLVDVTGTKRRWSLAMHLVLALCIAAAGVSLLSDHFLALSLAIFLVAAFASATYDTATDGYYMVVLNSRDQALYNGFRAGFYRLAMVFASGALVYLAGRLQGPTGSVPQSWMIVLLITAGIFLVAFAYHSVVLPRPAADHRSQDARTHGSASFLDVLRAYFRQDRIGVVIAFIIFYRLGEAMLLKLVQPFLKQDRLVGGLGLSTSEVGIVYGTIGILALIAGGILGGWLIARYGFRRCIWPMVIIMHLPDFFYVYLAYAQPSIGWAYPLVALEQFGYGVGFTVFTVYLMYSAEGEYKTSHYAISTGIMAFGMWLATYWSGELQTLLGYRHFFILVCLLAIPGMLTIPFLPKDKMDGAVGA
jgi:MFS transporter, PAT family, beta-lactamase induction signal transducer AmpG